jgi:hypothetical protein
MKKATKAPRGKQIDIEIAAPVFKTIHVKIRGIRPLIIHRFDQKAKAMIASSQTTPTSETKNKARQPKQPFQLFLGALHTMPDGQPGFPARAFKAAIIDACRGTQLTMVETKVAIFVNGEGLDDLVRLVAPPLPAPQTLEDVEYATQLKPYHARGVSMRCDVARNANGGADLRWRPWLPQWSANLEIEFLASGGLNEKTVLTLLQKAGATSGVGEWRPGSPFSKTGTYGRFTVVD